MSTICRSKFINSLKLVQWSKFQPIRIPHHHRPTNMHNRSLTFPKCVWVSCNQPRVNSKFPVNLDNLEVVGLALHPSGGCNAFVIISEYWIIFVLLRQLAAERCSSCIWRQMVLYLKFKVAQVVSFWRWRHVIKKIVALIAILISPEKKS